MDTDLASKIEPKDIVLINKSDLLNEKQLLETMARVSSMFKGNRILSISCEEKNIEEFIQALSDTIKEQFDTLPSDQLVITQERYRRHLKDCLEELETSMGIHDAILKAECLRRAVFSIGKITGRVDVEQILDIVFRDFCIGK
jgi:tRNA modification GTPase